MHPTENNKRNCEIAELNIAQLAYKRPKNSKSESIFNLPIEMIDEIFSYLKYSELYKASYVNKQWRQVAFKHFNTQLSLDKNVCDLTTWTQAFSRKAPTQMELNEALALLPKNIHALLSSPCPVFAGKLVIETHALIYIPKVVNDKEFNLTHLGQAVEKYLLVNPDRQNAGYLGEIRGNYYQQTLMGNMTLDVPTEKPYWVLMLKQPLPQSESRDYDSQQKLVAKLAHPKEYKYTFPKALATTACIFGLFLKSQESLFASKNFTRCEETCQGEWKNVIIGAFSQKNGLAIASNSRDGISYIGIAPMIKLTG